MMKQLTTTLFLYGVSCLWSIANTSPIGHWLAGEEGLPCFEYVGNLPYRATLAHGDSVKLDPDPWFVLGNYQLTLFAHVSGQYELITGQRAWARMNQGDRKNSGQNDARIECLDDKGNVTAAYPLVGIGSLAADSTKCRRTFGCGFAHYQYQMGKLRVSRRMDVKPSRMPSLTEGQTGEEGELGVSAFLLTVTIKNGSSKPMRLRYTESIRARYETMMQQSKPREWRKVKYTPVIDSQQVEARFAVETDDPLLFLSKDEMSPYEGFPPTLFMEDLAGNGIPCCTGDDLAYAYDLTLRPHEQKDIQLVIGFSMDRPYSNRQQSVNVLRGAKSFAAEWKRMLPQFPQETDAALRREMTWHSYMLEAMATYSDYYHETKIPQGTIYDYDWGQHASARDNFQHALATIYYNPALTRSIIRYMMHRTRENGEILLIEYGNGFAEHTCYQTSDQQLWFLWLLTEYLRVTGDESFLDERVACYPVKDMPRYSIFEYAQRCFSFLRNQIGTGSHGLVRLLNSDWCDAVFYTVAAPYNSVQPQGESHMNTAMALAILPSLGKALGKVSGHEVSGHEVKNVTSPHNIQTNLFVASINQWQQKLLEAYLHDWGNRLFPRRMYFAGRAWGDTQMFLDHLGFTLLMPQLPTQRKQSLYHEMQQRLYQGEKLGAREQEMPELTSSDLEPGSRENGGFWYSLNGPVILGVATFDKAEAKRLLAQMSLANMSACFPRYWSCYWSAADNIESSLMPSEGLPDQTWTYADIPIACAHPHAWMLYCYYKINE
ncbi:MAG: hypothetical protein IJK42_06570 [Prevotella sp.]|nr:hypothetical protein [Prevotella sp.]